MNLKSLYAISHITLWVAVIVLGVLFFFNQKSNNYPDNVGNGIASGQIKIAYFSLDSLQEKYDYLLSIKRTFEAKQTVAQDELVTIEKSFQRQVKDYQNKLPTMTQAQAEEKQKQLYQLQQKFEKKKQDLQLKLMQDQSDFAVKIQQAIEDYIKLHRDQYPYDLVIAAQPGLVFYKNASYDITSRLLEDLNAEYKAK